MKIEIKNRFSDAVIVEGEYENLKQACGMNKANLDGANLDGANLDGAKGYSESHAILTEIVKRQSVSLFVGAEWKCIAVISIHRICWPTIRKQFGKTAMRVFKKLADKGYDEWAKKYEEVMKNESI